MDIIRNSIEDYHYRSEIIKLRRSGNRLLKAKTALVPIEARLYLLFSESAFPLVENRRSYINRSPNQRHHSSQLILLFQRRLCLHQREVPQQQDEWND